MTTSTATTLKTWTGEHVKLELYQDGDVLVYQMTGQGIAEQIGTSRMSEADLLDTLLAPMGFVATKAGEITQPFIPFNLGRIEYLVGIKREVAKDPDGWDAARAEYDASEEAHRQKMTVAGFLTADGKAILPDWYSEDNPL